MQPRVTHLVESLEIGGAERLVSDFVRGRGKDRTTVICLEVSGSLGEELRRNGFRVGVAGMKGPRWKTLLRLRRLLKEHRPDILHCHNQTAHLFGAAAARISYGYTDGRMQVIMTKHGALPPLPGGVGTINRWLAGKSQVVAV